jgi:hypothetical protein
MNILNIIKEEANNIYNHNEYLKWKRKNVTLRGIKDVGEKYNNAGARFGDGLYTAYLSNKEMAKKYGDVKFVVNARPKNPKKFKDANQAEIWLYNDLIYPYLKENGLDIDSSEFYKQTNIRTEMLKKGYDGLDIIGREIVNYKPNEDNIRYFSNENQLINYYEFMKNYESN